jgi:hypothetical protein
MHQDCGGTPRSTAVLVLPFSAAGRFRAVRVAAPAEAASDLGALDQAVIDKADAWIRGNRQLNWKVVQRGFWVHGVDNLRAYLASAEHFTMQGRAELISCPTLITQAENDSLGAGAGAFFDALKCPRQLLRFSAVEGADGHCEMANRSLLNGRVLDWLDEQFAPGA